MHELLVNNKVTNKDFTSQKAVIDRDVDRVSFKLEFFHALISLLPKLCV